MSGFPASGLCHARIQPGRPQIDVVVEFEPDSQQQATFQHATGHRRVADRAEQDRVVCTQLVENRIGQHLPGGVVSPRPEVVLGLLDAGQHRAEDLDGLADHLRADAVTGDNRQSHDALLCRKPGRSWPSAAATCRCRRLPCCL